MYTNNTWRRTLKLDDITVKIHHDNVKITKHPYFLALRHDDSNTYQKFIQQKKYQKNKASASWMGFNQLVRKIHQEGFRFNPNDPISLKKKGTWVVTHGRHRICILRYLYGKNATITIKHSESKPDEYIVQDIQLP